MIDRIQFVVLNSCADDYELFYFPFAHANFGGQIFAGRSDVGEEPGRFKDDLSVWPIRVSALVVSSAIQEMTRAGLLSWRSCVTEAEREADLQATPIPPEEMQVYADYDCITFEDHLERYGYGPHEFYITQHGVSEIQRPEYSAYTD